VLARIKIITSLMYWNRLPNKKCSYIKKHLKYKVLLQQKQPYPSHQIDRIPIIDAVCKVNLLSKH